MLGGSQIYYFKATRPPYLCKLGGGDNQHGEFNKAPHFVKSLIQLGEDISNVASTSKGKEPMVTLRRRMPPKAQMKKSTQALKRNKIMMQAPRIIEKPRQPLGKGRSHHTNLLTSPTHHALVTIVAKLGIFNGDVGRES